MSGESHVCPSCGSALKRCKSKKGNGYFWACFEGEKHDSGKAVFLDDVNGKPQQTEKNKFPEPPKHGSAPTCKKCGSEMILLFSQKNQRYCWVCWGDKASGHEKNPLNLKKSKPVFCDFEEAND
jgi:ssDNA-binding Zn-finger/Zn-ribbon topoisomerase 1